MPSLAGWLHRGRLVAWSLIFLVVEAGLLLLLMLQQRGVIVPTGPSSIDFVSFYAAGKLVLAGTPALAYDQAAHYLAEQQATSFGTPYVFFYYPPVFLIICAGLALLPYLLAYALYQLATLAFLLWVLRRILGETRWDWVVPVLAFPATFWNLGMGQNAFLTAALLGGSTLLLDRKPLRAGMLLGAMCFKPHLALLAPVVLAAGRRWAAFAAATATLAALVLLSVLLFGWQSWRAFLQAAAASDQVYATGRINFAGYTSLFGALRMLGTPTATAYIAQAASAAVMISLVTWAWWRRGAAAARALLLSATLLALPLALLYDQLFLVVAAAWLLRDAGKAGLSGWEKVVLIAAYPAALLAPILGTLDRVPIAVFVSLAVTLLCARRALEPARRSGISG